MVLLLLHMSLNRLVVWHSVNVIRRFSELTLHQGGLVLGWVTIFRRVYHLSM